MTSHSSCCHCYNWNRSSCVCSICCHVDSGGNLCDRTVRALTVVELPFIAEQSVTDWDINRNSGSRLRSSDSTWAFQTPRDCLAVFFDGSINNGLSVSVRALQTTIMIVNKLSRQSIAISLNYDIWTVLHVSLWLTTIWELTVSHSW